MRNAACHAAWRFDRAGLKAYLKNGATDVFAARDTLCLWEGMEGVGLFDRCEGYARMLGELPANVLTPAVMADYARALAKDCGMSCAVLSDEELKALGCGGLLGVNAGSDAPAYMVLLGLNCEVRAEDLRTPEPRRGRTALVGKGLMFDAGGYHVKSVSDMDGMKRDMCGAANVLETMEYLARSGCDREVAAVLPLVQNLISPRALKSGDVLTTLSGQTVEVYNTDAEGRLVLCDALTAAQRLGADTVIDLATLTYGCQNALGDFVGGVFCNDDALVNALLGAEVEPLWRLPLHAVYAGAMRDSAVADLINYAPGRHAAASHAACFLQAFIAPETRWLHIDAVGPCTRAKASEEGAAGATGFGMRSLIFCIEGETE